MRPDKIRSGAFGMLLFLFFSVSCNEKKPDPAVMPTRTVNMPLQAEAFVVRARPLSEGISVPGTIIPYETTEIKPEIAGRIVELNIPEGRTVEKGTLLARLFDGDLQAQLKKLEVQFSIAEKTVERQHALLEISGISQQEYDLSQLQVNNLAADIELVRVEIGKTRIRAPFTGKIGLKNLSEGAYVTTASVLTTISQVTELKLDFTVPEKYSDRMQRGGKVTFTVNGLARTFTATILATESIIEANTRSLRVRAVIEGNDGGLVAGGFAKVSVDFGNNNNPLVVPSQAIIPEARGKKVIVYRSGKPLFTDVTTGTRDSAYVEITEGLKAGDTVLTTALLAVRPESSVRITKVN